MNDPVRFTKSSFSFALVVHEEDVDIDISSELSLFKLSLPLLLAVCLFIFQSILNYQLNSSFAFSCCLAQVSQTLFSISFKFLLGWLNIWLVVYELGSCETSVSTTRKDKQHQRGCYASHGIHNSRAIFTVVMNCAQTNSIRSTQYFEL